LLKHDDTDKSILSTRCWGTDPFQQTQRIGRYSQWRAASLWFGLYSVKYVVRSVAHCTANGGSFLLNDRLKTPHKLLFSFAVIKSNTI